MTMALRVNYWIISNYYRQTVGLHRIETELLSRTQMSRGGARSGAGRKTNAEKITEAEKSKVEQMLNARKLLLAELHDPEIMKMFKEALIECLQSKKAADRSWALRIMVEVFLKLPVPKVSDEEGKGIPSIEEILKRYEDKIADGLLEGTDTEPSGEESDYNAILPDDTEFSGGYSK
jgi:hypothetical protein